MQRRTHMEDEKGGLTLEDAPKMSNWRKDRGNIILLTFLYVLQGIPLGLAGTIPIMLQGMGVSYKEQAVFSFVYWPFAIKLLWAPVVDSLYVHTFGRRKSWLLPSQYLIGIFMIMLSNNISGLLEGKVNVPVLTVYFFALNLLAATQDIAVDGWALTILSKDNVGFASTCNSIGQTAGYFIAFTVFMALESADFCNKYLRVIPSDTGIVDLAGFLYFWGILFLVVTTLVGFLKHERQENVSQDGVFAAYKQLYWITKLPSIRMYILGVLTAKIGFAAVDAVTGLKLIEGGIPRETIAFLALAAVPIQVILPAVLSRFTTGPRPLDVFLNTYPVRLMFGFVFIIVVWWTPQVGEDGNFPFYYYAIVVSLFIFHQVAVYAMFVAIMAFHAKISDPTIGGTYMTLLNTVSNLAGQWSSTMVLWFVDPLSYYSDCEGTSDTTLGCYNAPQREECFKAGGHCTTFIDGYYVEVILTTSLGILWIWLARPRMQRLQTLGDSAWSISQ